MAVSEFHLCCYLDNVVQQFNLYTTKEEALANETSGSAECFALYWNGTVLYAATNDRGDYPDGPKLAFQGSGGVRYIHNRTRVTRWQSPYDGSLSETKRSYDVTNLIPYQTYRDVTVYAYPDDITQSGKTVQQLFAEGSPLLTTQSSLTRGKVYTLYTDPKYVNSSEFGANGSAQALYDAHPEVFSASATVVESGSYEQWVDDPSIIRDRWEIRYLGEPSGIYYYDEDEAKKYCLMKMQLGDYSSDYVYAPEEVPQGHWETVQNDRYSQPYSIVVQEPYQSYVVQEEYTAYAEEHSTIYDQLVEIDY